MSVKAAILHGGAGGRKASEASMRFLYDLLRRVMAGEAGAKALQGVLFAVTEMEKSGYFNAGKGSVRQADGQRRLDASVMDGQGRFGAVAGLTATWNAVGVASQIMETKHLLLTGEGANRFARSHGFPRPGWKRSARASAGGTVGAVVLDSRGGLAAATSTGGLQGALPGRVGDSALLGCGTYADRYAAVSCTGRGEDMIRSLLAFQAAGFCRQSVEAQRAADLALRVLGRVAGRGGLVVVDRFGRTGVAFNTVSMAFVARAYSHRK